MMFIGHGSYSVSALMLVQVVALYTLKKKKESRPFPCISQGKDLEKRRSVQVSCSVSSFSNLL